MDNFAEYLLFQPNTGARTIRSIEDIPQEGLFWLDIRNPTSRDLHYLETHIGVHPLTIEDIQLGETREKCESYEQYLFLSVQLLNEEEFYGRIHTPMEESIPKGYYCPSANTNCYILIFSNCLVTIHTVGLSFMSHILTRRIAKHESSPLTSDWLAYLILDEIVDDFTRQASLLQAEVDTIEDLTLNLGRFDQTDMLRRIYQAHRRTTILSRLIQPKIDFTRTLAKRYTSRLESRTAVYFRDVQDHLFTLKHNLAQFKDALDRSHDNYVGQSDIELAMAGHRMNMTVKKLTATTFIIGSGMAISSIMGMNIRVPFQEFPKGVSLFEHLPFSIMILAMCIILGGAFTLGRRKSWF